MSIENAFTIEVENPRHEYDTGRIVLKFNYPKMFFGFHPESYRYATLPPEERQRVVKIEAIRAFTRMIEKELEHAFKEQHS